MTAPELTEIPTPQILDPDRLIMPERDDLTIDEHRDRAGAAVAELHRTCEYGRALRQELQAVRVYLSEHVPADPQDAAGWDTWRALYASVVSSLAGAAGDSGFGGQEATLIAQNHGVLSDH